MKKLILTAFILFSTSQILTAQVIWKQTNGPTNGSTNSMSVDSLQRVYVCTGGAGVWQSTDNGTTWHGLNKGLRSLPVRWLESSTIEHGSSGTVAYVYALTHKKELMRREISKISSDVQWEYLDSLAHDYQSSTATLDINQLLTNAKGYLYLATSKFGVLRSKFNGKQFDSVNRQAPVPDTFVQCMTVDRKQNLYAVTYKIKTNDAFVWRSTDDGDTWQKLPTEPPNPGAINKMVVADDGSISLAYYANVTDTDLVYRSTDLGQTWNLTLKIPYQEHMAVDQIRHSVINGDLWLNAHGPTYRSTNNGATWFVTNPIKMGDEPFDLVEDSSARLYQCAIPDGIFRSEDTGKTWTNIDQTLLVQHLDGNEAIDSKGDVVACSQFNMYISKDNGDSWVQSPNELDEGQLQLVTFDHEDYLYYGCALGLFRSHDVGMTFDTLLPPLTDPNAATHVQIFEIEVSPKDELFVSTGNGLDGKDPNPWFIRSKDRGKSWTRINTSNDYGIPTYESITNVGFTPTDPSLDDTIYASGTSNNLIYRSINDGINWDVVNREGQGIAQILCDSAGSVFRLEDRVQGGLYRSVDGGYTWAKVFPDTSNGNVALDQFIQKYRSMMLDRKGRIVISTSDTSQGIGGFYRSANSTFTKWDDVSSGMTVQDYYDDRPINAQMIVQNKKTGVYFANSRGASVYKTLPDMASFWNAVPYSPLSPSVAEPVNYPNPFNLFTKIECDIPNSGFVKVSVYDVMGRLIKVLYNGYMDSGKHSFIFDAGINIPSGKYAVVLESGTETTSHWMTVTK